MPFINSANNRFTNQPVTSVSASYTALLTDFIIEVNSTLAPRTITLPPPAVTGNVGKAFLIKDSGGSAAVNNITITPSSGTIDANASALITANFGSLQIFCDGTNYYSYGVSALGTFVVKKQSLTATGTYTPTAGMLYCEAEIVGGGGAGGGAPAPSSSQFSLGVGGGAGEYAYGLFSAAQIGGSQAITIGAGGAANSGTTGGNGGTTSFGSLLTALGGGGGATSGSQTAFNAGGTLGGTGGTGGNYRIPGGAGSGGTVGVGPSSNVLFGGMGGTSQLGAGGRAATGNSASQAGGAGLGYGAGGGGAISTGSAQSGGPGAPGIVLIREYIALASANLPNVALAKGGWNRQTFGTPFTPGATVVQTGFSSDPGSTPSNSGSRIDLSSLTQTEGSGLTISQFQVTMTQAGTYQICAHMALYNSSSSAENCMIQCIRNSTTVLSLGGCWLVGTASSLETASILTAFDLSIGDTIDFRANTAQAAGFQFASIAITILQLPSSTIVPLASWNAVSGTSQALVSSSNYFTQNSSLTTLTLPLAANAGTVIEIAGGGSGGWTLAQNAGQSINFGNRATTTGTGGSISSTNQYDAIQLLCLVANTQWTVLKAVGNLTIV